MRIRAIKATNFRSLEDFELTFSGTYSAISGKNNSGKTNIIRAIRAVIPETESSSFALDEGLNFKNHVTTWRKKDASEVSISLQITLGREEDAALFEFLKKFSSIQDATDSVDLELTTSATSEGIKVRVRLGDTTLPDYESTEVGRKVQALGVILFHNSTDAEYSYFHHSRGFGGTLGQFASSDRRQFEEVRGKIDGLVQKLAKRHQAEVAALLGRLEEKYVVGLTVPRTNLDWTPVEVSLGGRSSSLPLNDWGSGTRNRTEIILTLLRAKKASEQTQLSDRIKPVVIIEEPESFLHPSAQAEFGRVLQELAAELQVQVIVTTHSPYMLSSSNPSDNILVERAELKREAKGSIKAASDDDNWMRPFALALGIDNKEFEPWKGILSGLKDSVILVEGDLDKQYLELLRAERHGEKRLKFDGEILAYGGKDALKNSAVLRLVASRSSRCLVTFDLDCLSEIERHLTAVGMTRGKDYFPVGRDSPGFRDIEGLIPDVVRSKVYADNPALLTASMNGTNEEKATAKRELKGKLLAAFKASTADPAVAYAEFYKLAAQLNKALTSKPKSSGLGH